MLQRKVESINNRVYKKTDIYIGIGKLRDIMYLSRLSLINCRRGGHDEEIFINFCTDFHGRMADH